MFYKKKLIFLFLLLSLFLTETIYAADNFTSRNLRKVKQESIYSHIDAKQSHAGPVFFGMKYQETASVKKYINIYAKDSGKKWLNNTLKKAAPYTDFINEKIKEYNLPEELLYLPVVESAYNPKAVSKSGAAGLWQFMMNSIGPYDMMVTPWIDERRDFIKSTEGALKKLKYNYSKLGDWYLALAAYNCGLGMMQRTIKSSGINDFWELADKGLLRKETAEYVPKFLAISKAAKFRGRFGLENYWEDKVYWETIQLDFPVDLNLLAKESKVPLSILKKYNAELKYNITPMNKKAYKLKVRKDYYEKIKTVLDNKGNQLVKYDLYKIQTGDTLYMISKHYGIPVNTILKYNKGLKSNNLKIGQNIIIPNIKDVKKYSPENDGKKDFQGLYHVQKGDTLWSIARKHKTSPEMLAYHNNISVSDIINYGITLKVPLAD